MSEPFALYTDKNQLTDEFKSILTDPAIPSRYRTLKKYAEEQKLVIDEQELAKLIKKTRQDVFKQVFELNLLDYYIAATSDDWGQYGKEAGKLSFMRLLLKKKPDEEITPTDYQEFEKRLEEAYTHADLIGLEIPAAQMKYKQSAFELCGIRTPADRVAPVNQILRFLEIPLYLQAGASYNLLHYLLFEGTVKKVGGYTVYFVEKELARSHSHIMQKVALIGNHEIYVRKESLAYIFKVKWEQFLGMPQDMYPFSKYERISNAIRQHTFSLYGITDTESLQKHKKSFIDDFTQTITWHELAHSLIQHRLLPLEDSAITDVSNKFCENIYSVMHEVLADFAPKVSPFQGPFWHMVELSKTDPKRAERMFYRYMSDVYFYDTDDTFMFMYSDILLLLMLKFVNTDKSIRFNDLEQALSMTQNQAAPSLIETMLEWMKKGAADLKRMTQEAQYKLSNGKEYSFDAMHKLTLQQFKKVGYPIDEQSYYYHTLYWSTFYNYIGALTSKKADIKRLFDERSDLLLQKVFELTAEPAAVEQYKADVRRYIVDRLAEILGLTA